MRNGLFSLAAALVAILYSATVEARTYRNDNYGVSADIPGKYFICGAKETGSATDHGFTLLLDDHPKDCGAFNHRRQIDLFAFFNAPDYASTTEAAEDFSKGKAVVQTAPKDLSIDQNATILYRTEQPTGEIEINLLTQNRAVPTRVHQYTKEPWIIYEISLSTTKEHFDEDMKTLRIVLPKFHLHTTR